MCHTTDVIWVVELADEFETELRELPEDVQIEVPALARLLQQVGPRLGRPRVDTLHGSRHANMKELRFSAADGEWRVALRSIRNAKRSYWLRGINQALAKNDSTAG